MKRNQDQTHGAEQANTPPKRRKTSKPSLEPHRDVDLEESIDLAIGRMNSPLLAKYIVRQTTLFGSDLSPLELHDLLIPGRRTDSSFPPSSIL